MPQNVRSKDQIVFKKSLTLTNNFNTRMWCKYYNYINPFNFFGYSSRPMLIYSVFNTIKYFVGP